MFIFLVIFHIITYLLQYFREWEIENFGKPDIHGVMRATFEQFLYNLETLISSFIFGFMIKNFFSMDYDYFHEHSFIHYWLVIDILIMLTQ